MTDKLPMADPAREQMAQELFSTDLSPDLYAAREGHRWQCFSFDDYRYSDAALSQWIQRLGDIFFRRNGAPSVEELRNKLLSTAERHAIENEIRKRGGDDPSISETPTDEALHRHVMANLGLLAPSYASGYPGCEAFCQKAIGALFKSLRRLNQLPRSDPFWAATNRRPTMHKLQDYCRHQLKSDPGDALALWTMAALEVASGSDGFGYPYWKALHDLGNLDLRSPICAALLQGGSSGISDAALATLLLTIDAAEAARPLLREHHGSADPNIRDWAQRVLGMLDAAPESYFASSKVLGHVRAANAAGIAMIFYAADAYSCVICDARTGITLDRFTDYWGHHRDFAVAADGTAVAYLTNDHKHGYMPACICLRPFGGPTARIKTDIHDGACMAITPDFTRAIVGGHERLAAWDLQSDRKLRDLPLADDLSGVAISDSGRHAVSASPGRVLLWDLDNGRCLASADMDARIAIDSIVLDGSRVTIIDIHGVRHLVDFGKALGARQ